MYFLPVFLEQVKQSLLRLLIINTSLSPVLPDWSDSSDLLGYKNIQGKFQADPMIDTIKEAKKYPDTIYFVCLDEMNLGPGRILLQ